MKLYTTTKKRPTVPSLSLMERIERIGSLQRFRDVFRASVQPQRPMPSAPAQAARLESTGSSIQQLWPRFWRWLTTDIDSLRAWTLEKDGQILWSATDRRTGQGLYEVSETEMRQWIEQRVRSSRTSDGGRSPLPFRH